MPKQSSGRSPFSGFRLPALPGRRSAARPEVASDVLASRAAITEFLFVSDRPAAVDFAFVLGSPTLSSIEPAIDLYARGLAPRIVISGHGPRTATEPPERPEAEIYKAYAIERGVRAEDIIIETTATNTLENFQFTLPVIERQIGWDTIHAVSISGKPFHMRRALMTARAQWPKHLKLLMLPSNHPDDPPAATWWQTDAGRNFVLAELRAIGTYGSQGDLAGF
jgi:uncharacterized SAM-binding protein YcdF (DUF218 family)